MRLARRPRRFTLPGVLSAVIILATCRAVFAAAAGGGDAGHALDPLVLAGVALMLVVAKLCGEVFERWGQPAVLGELVGGLLLGAASLAGAGLIDRLRADAVVGALAEIGVIILLFEVGLESNLGELAEVWRSALLVAVAGVVVPFALGWGVAALFLPASPALVHIFVGATLSATSVGITARVLSDLGRLRTRTARIILGAAIIDDVLGLVILAVVKGAVEAQAAGAALSPGSVAGIAGKAVAFLLGALLVGRLVVPQLFRGAGRLEGRGVLLALAVSICFALSWAAASIGLAAIVGAFAAGLLLEEAHFERLPRHTKHDLEELLRPLGLFLVPIFFVLVGLRVDLRAFGRPELLAFAAALTLAAVVGKQVCSLAVVERGTNRLAVGLGMIPRGEVGLIFAGIGAGLTLPNALGAPERVIGAHTFGAIVIMVIVTTLVTPPLLKWALARSNSD